MRIADIQTITSTIGLIGKYAWLWLVFFAGSAVIHVGTAILRLESFFPFPQALDFSSYYAAAWSVRLRISPYSWSESLLEFLSESQQLMNVPPVHNSPPLWAILLQPLTALLFPSAATLWLVILLIGAILCHFMMVRIAGYSDWKIMLATLPITLTFGPLFLNLTLGQNGIFLLLGALLLGEALQHKHRPIFLEILSVLAWIIAVAAKVYPLLWIGCLPFVKRWRLLFSVIVFGLLAFGVTAVLAPELTAEYWFTFLPSRTEHFITRVSIDDQSLAGFLRRIGQSNQFSVPGLNVAERQEIFWQFSWELSSQSIHYISLIVQLLLGGWVLFSWIRSEHQAPDGFLYALVLFSLLLFPHMARYNHILALPAMAWLWRRGVGYRKLVISAYLLFGLSRLNHLWAITLPVPFGPIASGFGLFGVLVLIGGVLNGMQLKSHRTVY